jgi:hypothetical protein
MRKRREFKRTALRSSLMQLRFGGCWCNRYLCSMCFVPSVVPHTAALRQARPCHLTLLQLLPRRIQAWTCALSRKRSSGVWGRHGMRNCCRTQCFSMLLTKGSGCSMYEVAWDPSILERPQEASI